MVCVVMIPAAWSPRVLRFELPRVFGVGVPMILEVLVETHTALM